MVTTTVVIGWLVALLCVASVGLRERSESRARLALIPVRIERREDVRHGSRVIEDE